MGFFSVKEVGVLFKNGGSS